MTSSKIYKIHDKTGWLIDLSLPYDKQFYPSSLKKIIKDEPEYENIFTVKDVNADEAFLEETFFPLYEKEVASRKLYIFKKGEQREKILERVSGGKKYRCLACWVSNTSEFAGGIMYYEENNNLYISLRTFKKDINREYRLRSTIDYWMEKKFRDFALKTSASFISHGRDKYPNRGYIGLPLFKLKVGASPIIPMRGEDNITEYTYEEIKKGIPLVFFDNPDASGFFRKCVAIYDGKTINPFMIPEYKSVCAWKNIEFEGIDISSEPSI